MIKVTVSEKGGEKKDTYFDKTEISLGRIQGNDLVLNKKNISKKHAQIIKRNGDMIILDLGSTNGTFVNGRRITAPKSISFEDKIYIGDYLIYVEEVPDDDVSLEEDLTPAPELDEAEIYRHTVNIGKEMKAQEQDAVATQFQESVKEVEDEVLIEPDEDIAIPEMPEEEQDEEEIVPVDEIILEEEEPHPVPIGAKPQESQLEEKVSEKELPKPVMAEKHVPSLPQQPKPSVQPQPKPSVQPQPQPSVQPQPQMPLIQAQEKPITAKPEVIKEEIEDHYHEALCILFKNAESTVFKDYPPDLIEPTDEEWQKFEDGVLRLVEKMRRLNQIDASIEAHALSQDVLYEFMGLGCLEYYLADDSIRRILLNGENKIFITRGSKNELASKRFSCHEAIMKTIIRLVKPLGYSLKDMPQRASGKLPDGISFQILMPPLAPSGPIIMFEKPRKSVRTLEELIKDNMLNEEIYDYLKHAVSQRKNFLICSRSKRERINLLNSIAQLIPKNERIVLVEKQSDFRVDADDVVVLDKAEAVKKSIKILPIIPSLKADRVLYGDLEPEEISPFLKEILNGLEGTLATAYATSVEDLVKRFILQLQLSLGSIDSETARSLFYSTVNVIIVLSFFPDDKSRITQISDIPPDIRIDQFPPVIFKFEYERTDENGNVIGKFVKT